MIGIIVAMGKELDLLLGLIDNPQSVEVDGYAMHTGSLGGREVVAMQCGIGKVNAAIGTLAMISHFNPELIINSGVAGGTGSDAGILDIVIATEVAYHDVWCGPGTAWGEAAGCPATFTCGVDAAAIADKIGAKAGLVASGDIFVSRAEDIERILALYPQAKAVDMESGAIAQVCYLKGVPMVCIRVVSDTPGQADNISQYENFWEDAPQGTFHAVSKLISLYGKD